MYNYYYIITGSSKYEELVKFISRLLAIAVKNKSKSNPLSITTKIVILVKLHVSWLLTF